MKLYIEKHLFFSIWDRIFPSSPSWPGTQNHPPASASVLNLEACITRSAERLLSTGNITVTLHFPWRSLNLGSRGGWAIPPLTWHTPTEPPPQTRTAAPQPQFYHSNKTPSTWWWWITQCAPGLCPKKVTFSVCPAHKTPSNKHKSEGPQLSLVSFSAPWELAS